MIVLVTAFVGIAIGVTTALRRGGKPLDALHYAAGYGIAFTLLGFLIAIIVHRNFLG
ncbi:MAG: hypothetical protein ACRC14_08990 [Paracoccaceae bacterium]